jgi:Zn finger protein HypA/HybF involved in hydrogenase expression
MDWICRDCGTEFADNTNEPTCPECGAKNPTPNGDTIKPPPPPDPPPQG